MNLKEKKILSSIVLDLDLLVVSLDRLSHEPSDELWRFIRDQKIFEQLVRRRSEVWKIIEAKLTGRQLAKLERRLEALPYWQWKGKKRAGRRGQPLTFVVE